MAVDPGPGTHTPQIESSLANAKYICWPTT
jgi:hypothetical protein